MRSALAEPQGPCHSKQWQPVPETILCERPLDHKEQARYPMFQQTVLKSSRFTQGDGSAYRRLLSCRRALVAKSKVVVIVLLSLLVSVAGSSAADSASAAMRTWDRILADGFFADMAEVGRTIQQDGNKRVYMYSALVGDAGDGEVLFSVVVAVGPAGKQLDPVRWSDAFSAASDSEKLREFPRIGARAQRQAPLFSPDGALSGIMFTTTDELFDVRVSIYEASSTASKTVPDIDDLARQIDRAYAGTFQ